MARPNNEQFSTKRILIGKANSTMVVVVGVAAFITAFSLVASRSLLIKRAYQSRVITAQEEARDQLQANLESVDALKASYDGFVSREENLIGGSRTGNGEQDGDNAKIVLDALPGTYDYPALITSLEKILVDRNYPILSITGTDEEGSQDGGEGSDSESFSEDIEASVSAGNAVAMPFELTAEGNYSSLIDLLRVFQRSVRPIYINTLTLSDEGSSGQSNVQLNANGQSFYQPEEKLDIQYEVVE